MPAAYATRLRLEGGVLAVAGLAASAALVAKVPQSRRWPANTAGQVALVAVGLVLRGPKSVEGWIASAEPVDAVHTTGEPTPLWHVPVPMLLGAMTFKGLERLNSKAGWDASLRVTLGSAVVGLSQALVLAPTVARAEAQQGRTYFRLPGSRLGTGTRLGFSVR